MVHYHSNYSGPSLIKLYQKMDVRHCRSFAYKYICRCQRRSECPICLQPISFKDPTSQELLDAVEHERKLRTNRPRNTSIFHHPTLGDFELQHLPISGSDSELEERIIQHLATSSATGRARQLARIEGRRSRSYAQGHPHFLVFSTHLNGPSATSVTSSANERDGSSTPSVVRIAASNSSLLTIGENSTSLTPLPSSAQGSIVVAHQHGMSSTNRYKESLTRSTQGWKEKLFTCSSSTSCHSAEVLREVDDGIVPACRLMDHLEIRDEDRTNVASISSGTVDSLSANPTEEQIIETSANLSVNDNSTQAPCVASSASS
ncbi:E3 ubiquitin-protein ligase RHF2A-like isoform X1 [Primulina tabacum]|uniref:E3 ubiquitin-protein ligase RHF2A-like isoform X1 n=1 Tax=Primulina tabacum TaxID=48773 RepID=UPI003F59526E